MRTLRLWLGLLLLAGGSTAWATDYYVVAEGQSTPTPPWTNWGWAHTNLIEAVANAGNGDTVYVTNNNTYYLTNEVRIVKSITVRSWAPDGGLDRDTTIINGNYPVTSNRCFYINAVATVAGVTITNGYGASEEYYYGGGGVFIYTGGTLTNCIITGNRWHGIADGSINGGGGVYLRSTVGALWNCTISRNTSYASGGGIKVFSGDSKPIINCIISDNLCSGYGGGINSYNSPGLVVSNCIITANTSTRSGGGLVHSYQGKCDQCELVGNTSLEAGGGIQLAGPNALVRHCLIYNNKAPSGAGLHMYNGQVQNCVIWSNEASADGGGGIYFTRYGEGKGYSNNCIENTIVWANRSGGAGVYSNCYNYERLSLLWFTNSCIAQQGLGERYYPTNCISNDPKFFDTATTNVRLQANSPCINAGTNREWMSGAADLDGRRRIDHFSGIVDMGAYEYLSRGSFFTSY